MTGYIIYLIVQLLSKFFSILPVRTALGIGRLIGQVVYVLYPNRKNIAFANLLSVFGLSKSISELKLILKETFISLSQTVVEMLRLPLVDKKYIERYIKIVGLHHIKEALKENRGAILLTAHFGNWELLAIVGAMMGYPMKVLVREQKPKKVNQLLNKYRESKGSKVISKGFETREIIHALRNNKCVGILADQDAGKEGIFIDFLGRPASTPPGPIAFALKTGAKVIPCFIIRKKGPRHKVEINSPLKLDYTGEKQKVIKEGLREFSNVLGKYVKNNPNQWLWFHKRWKSTPPTRVLILHDGKAGHLNQSRAVVKQIKRMVKNKYSDFPFRIKEVKITFRKKLYRFLLNVFSNFSGKRCNGCLKCLKFTLTSDCYGKLAGTCSDIVVSCGSSLEGVNVIMEHQSMAKNVVVMNPSLVNLDKFDLAVIPEHDKVKSRPNIVRTKGALNLIDEEYIDQQVERLRNQLPVTSNQKLIIGVLIGGDTKNYLLSVKLMDKVLSQILNLAKDLDADLLLTTSRRTSKEVDNLIKKRLKNNPKCKLLVIANERNIEGVVPAILGSSDIVIVSGESISMVSEAVSSGKRVIVFEAERRGSRLWSSGNRRKKHERFLQNLAREDYINLTSPNNLAMTTKKVWEEKRKIKKLDDKRVIDEAVGRLI